MKNDADLARETAEWLKQGSRPLPASVLDGTMSAVSRTRQLSPAYPRWTVRLARAVALGAAAAAVVMAVAYGPLVADRIRGLLPPPTGAAGGAGPSIEASPSPAPSPSPARAGKIAFYSDRNGTTEIYVMNADGSGQTNVSHGPGDFSGPDGWSPGGWSPDGSRIAFTSDRDGKGEIYVVNPDGSGLINVSNDPCGAGGPGWSPDGSRIAFTSGPTRGMRSGLYPPPTAGGCVSTIYVVNADGSGRTNLTNGPADFGAWSPDGSRYAFTSDRDGNWEIYVVNADGSGLTRLTNNPGEDGNQVLTVRPVWSPDSSRVSFWSLCKVVGGKVGLYEVNADGSGLTYLGLPPYDAVGGNAGCAPTYDGPPLSVGSASYAPDGTRDALAVALGDGKGEEIYVINADGSGLTRLTNNLVDDSNIVWSPDSSRIAWHRSIAGNTEIWVVNPDGSGLTRLSIGPDILRDGGWSPDSSRIAFGSSRDGNEEIYVVNADGSGLTNLSNNPGQDNGPVWSPAR